MDNFLITVNNLENNKWTLLGLDKVWGQVTGSVSGVEDSLELKRKFTKKKFF
jgi:hypothetical protein